ELFDAVFSPDGTHIVTASNDTTAIVWDAATEVPILHIEPKDGGLFSARFDASGDRLLLAAVGGSAHIFDAHTGQLLMDLPGSVPLFEAEFSPDGSRVVTAQKDGALQIWNIAAADSDNAPQPVRIEAHHGAVNSATFSPDGAFVLSAGDDGVACLT